MPFTGKRIPTAYARQLAKNYRNQKRGKPLLIDDTEAVWFPKEVFLEALNLPLDTDTGNISGIRVYLGAYENRSDYPRNPDWRRQLTLVLAQTESRDNGSGTIVERDILDDPDANPSYPNPIDTFNDGQICPPPKCDDRGLLNFP